MMTKNKTINWYESISVDADYQRMRDKHQREYEVTLSLDGNKHIKPYTTKYFMGIACDSPKKFDVLYAICSDAVSYLNSKPVNVAYDHYKHLDSFSNEFGYEKPSEAIKAFEGCKESFNWFKSFMSENEILSLEQHIRDIEEDGSYKDEEYL